MKTFSIEISEEQLRLIRACAQNVLMQNLKSPGVLTEEEHEEIDMIAGMILDVVESDHEEDVVHGFCW